MAIQHILVATFPAHGHINPLLSLARLMLPHGFSFTFAVADCLTEKLQQDINQLDFSCSSSRISVASLESSSSQMPSTGPFSFRRLVEVCGSTRPSFERLLRDIASDISCVITDAFVTWSHEVASQFKIPTFSFYTANAHAFSIVVHSQSILSKVASVQDREQPLDLIPGAEPLCARDLPQSIRESPLFVALMLKHVTEVSGIILNTVYEIESIIMEHIRKKIPVYAIGPLMLMLKSADPVPMQPTHEENTTEDSLCLKWLDSKPASSVIFISFGTSAKMDSNVMRELALGIESSKQSYIWVIRTDMIDEPLQNMLPEGFLDRTKERGLIVKWAPQVQVLSHQAIGGFLTHCGWNSLTENLSLGAVPMICWPQIAEQKLNARITVNEWRVGLELKEENGVVKAEEIERAVIDIMQGDIGKELKARAFELKKKMLSTVEEGGMSRNSLLALMQDIRKLTLKPMLTEQA